MTVTNSGGATFNDAVQTDTSVVLTDTTDAADIVFNGALTTATLTTAGEAYDVAINGGATITNAVTFLNTGTLELGDDAADVMLFTGGVTATAPSTVFLDGQVRTAGQTVELGDAGTGVTLQGGLSIIDTTNNGGVAAGGNITLGGSVQGTLADTQSLTLNAGTAGLIQADLAIGGTVDLATLTVTNSGGATFDGAVQTDTSVVLTDTTDTTDIVFNGALTTATLTTAGAVSYTHLTLPTILRV